MTNGSQKPLFWTLAHQMTNNNPRNYQLLSKILFWEIWESRKSICWHFWKWGSPNHLIQSWESWIRDQYQSKTRNGLLVLKLNELSKFFLFSIMKFGFLNCGLHRLDARSLWLSWFNNTISVPSGICGRRENLIYARSHTHINSWSSIKQFHNWWF